MKPLLVVTHPRRIPACVDAFAALTCDVAYISGEALPGACTQFNEIVRSAADYTHLMVCADDCVVTQNAVDAVVALLAAGNPAVTGWCRLDRTHPQANITIGAIRGDTPVVDAYDWWLAADVASYPGEVVPTGFMGMALTGMDRGMWLRHPLGCFTNAEGAGWSSDFHLSARLRDAGIPMVAARSGYVDHVKERWQMADRDPAARLLIGEIPMGVIWQCE
jgi:hypothetical protein